MKFVYILCSFILPLISYSQGVEIDTDSHISVYFDSQEHAVTDYVMDKGKTLYQASRIFKTPISTILSYNNIKDANDIAKGSKVIIPIDFKFTYRGESIESYKSTKFIPLTYVVQPKDNLFRIAKIYCSESVEALMKRNDLTTKDLTIGQTLTLGWIALDPQNTQLYSNLDEPVTPAEIIGPMPQTNLLDKIDDLDGVVSNPENDSMSRDELDATFKKEKGIAIWTKSSKGHSRYALHPTARLNSEIELYNPLVNRKVTAKVVGRIPKGAYNSDVSVIISPATAVGLGALDNRFKVEMTYKQ